MKNFNFKKFSFFIIFVSLINLTYFLGDLSSFSPYVFGGIGALILGMKSNSKKETNNEES